MSKNLINNYQNSKIYKLVEDVNQIFYIGSTTENLNIRYSKHKYEAKRSPNQKVYKYFNSIGWDHVTIQIIDSVNVNSLQELLAIENNLIEQYLGNTKCLNHNLAFTGLTKQQQYKRYHESHRDEHNEQMKASNYQRVTCECGATITKGNKTNHIRTQKHQKLLESQSQ